MSSYKTHIIAGLLVSFVFYYFLRELVILPPEIALISIFFIFLGSIFPDVDHKNSKIHIATKSFIVLILTLLFGYLALPYTTRAIVSSSLVGLGSYSLISVIKPKHRGLVHTFKFCFLSSITVGTLTYFAFDSFVPGLFFFLSYLSHLVVDFAS